MSTSDRTRVIRIAGILIVLLALGSALLPMARHIPGRTVVGLMLMAAGAIELFAGLRLALDPGANFFTVLNLVILWLVVRAGALLVSAFGSPRPLCNWVYFASAVDFLLAVLLLGGLPVAVLVYGLFGTTSDIVATFAWILAVSFVAAGLLLIAAAPLEASESDGPRR